MKKETKKTWVFYLNFILLQWFCIRLVRIGYDMIDDDFIQTGWSILTFVVPCTGWSTPYRWIYRTKRSIYL